jgi:predicted SprT family Zn-dependent metalloprotease
MKTKKSIERQHKQVKQRNTHKAKTDKTKYKTRLKKTGQKLKQAQQIPNTKARVSIQSEEPLEDDSEEQAVHIIPH